MLYSQVHFYVTKIHYYITFVAFAMNSVISIIFWFCPVLFIHLFTPNEGPITQQNIHGGLCGPDWLDFNPPPPLNMILRGPYSKFSAQGPEFLATALPGSDDFVLFDSLDGNGACSQMFYAIFQFCA